MDPRKFCSFYLFVLLGLGFLNVNCERELTSPVVTNWGVWQAFEYCPSGSYVVGMQLKTESYGGIFFDDTALNGVTLFCDALESRNDSDHNPIKSGQDIWGSVGSKYWCSGVASGFQLQSENNQGPFADDTAANNLRIFCNGRQSAFRQGDGLNFGSWTEAQQCSKKEAICGVSTQIYTNHGSGDETAMDGIKVKCCDIPDPAVICLPVDVWDLVIECDNKEALSPTTCSYQRKLGTTNATSTSENHWEVVQMYTEIGFSLNAALSNLNMNFDFNVGQSNTTGFNWSMTNSEVWHEEVTTSVSFDVPPRVVSKLFQTLGSCGIYNARTNVFRRVDKNHDTLAETVTIFTV